MSEDLTDMEVLLRCPICNNVTVISGSTEFVWRVWRGGVKAWVRHRVCDDCVKQAIRQRLEILGRF